MLGWFVLFFLATFIGERFGIPPRVATALYCVFWLLSLLVLLGVFGRPSFR